VAPQEWDAGINAGLLNYQFTGSQGHTAGQGEHNRFSLYLNGGLNLAGWRLRSNGSPIQDQNGQRRVAAFDQLRANRPARQLRHLHLGESFGR
jgi:outer membrane usher protein FimD/PapC